MKRVIHSSERGQALILLVFAAVGLLAFTALAIDGGMVYADRRHAQNAADASSLAGGGVAALNLENSYVTYEDFDCNDYRVLGAMEKAKDAAVSRAGSNDFGIDKEIADNNGVVTECVDDFYNGSFVEKYIDVRTKITSETQAAFVHFVFNGPLVNTVEAVTRIWPNTSIAYGNAIVALNNAECFGNKNGVVFSGNSTNNITGGGVFSNGCLTGNGTSFTVNVIDGTVSYVGEATGSTQNISPPPTQAPVSLQSKSYNIPEPDCSGLPNWGASSGGGTIYPGIYSKITLTNGTLELKPGLYCITGSPKAIDISGGKVFGNGVTLYITTGSVKITGGADVSDPGLIAPQEYPDPSPAIPGVLMYLARGNTGTIELEGNSDSEYVGVLYAPSGDVKITGTSGHAPTFHTQIVGKNVEVSGNAQVEIIFNGSENYQIPSTLELFK